MTEPLHVHYEDLATGEVIPLGVCAADADVVAGFAERFVPGWDVEGGAPDALVYVLWSRLFGDKARAWAQSKVLAVDGLRFMRNPPAGELLRGRMTILGKDPVGDDKGIVIAQHDLLDEAGRLVFSCLTRAVFARR
ncbi:MAG: acyl dehydratase [Alphaproteobacteria bacterium]|nr:acyl dehydratase [Alphaproteobacteria bacterium]MBU1525107.1 acyl dehydratase [Alphaproteobacteria bacterium]MBU2118250.1 acyl dehydratase [Alphaproteobacteria bacterium]MBU2351307.1 acyl dehydratase [Alphaproteobacteria bacterium]MBU2381498.1 acyl dehydratase [Alphaproteobacteria bacterium]